MEFNGNPYYSPERCGLEIFDSIDTAGSYEFSMFVIWKNLEDNTLWYGTDSGCSCPTPFEDFRGFGDMTQVTLDESSFKRFDDELAGHFNITTSEYKEMSKKVKDFLKRG